MPLTNDHYLDKGINKHIAEYTTLIKVTLIFYQLVTLQSTYQNTVLLYTDIQQQHIQGHIQSTTLLNMEEESTT